QLSRLPGGVRRQPSDPLRCGILPTARPSGAAGARLPGADPDRRRRRRVPARDRRIAAWLLEQSSRFLKPVYAGDTLYPMLEIVELKPQRTTGVARLRSTVHNQRGELVLEGEQAYLLRRRPAA